MAMIQEVRIWYDDGGKEWIEQYIPTLHEIIKEDKSRKGVYAILVEDVYAYIGESGKYKNRSVEDRLCEHAYRLATNPKCYFGIPKYEINNKKVRISVVIIEENQEINSRKSKEISYIDELKPYTQSSNYKKYSKNGYKEKDLCIYKKFRYEAYRRAMKLNSKL